MQNGLEGIFIDLTRVIIVFYYISYSVISPDKVDKVSNRILSLSGCSDDQDAVGKFGAFNKHEALLCRSLGKTFLPGNLFDVKDGKVRIIK